MPFQMMESRTPTQSRNEEIANSISHGLGFLVVVITTPILIDNAIQQGKATTLIGHAVFALTASLLYLSSTLYHAFPLGRVKRIFRLVDHCAIFTFIAGTYTPFTLGVLGGMWGWSLIAIVWSLALMGISLKASGRSFPKLSMGLYIGMGWSVLIAVRPLWLLMPKTGLLWILSGGLSYTVGIGFYQAKRLAYNHLIWHLFVMTGTGCHFIAVLRYSS